VIEACSTAVVIGVHPFLGVCIGRVAAALEQSG
jgi:hypothetical protein